MTNTTRVLIALGIFYIVGNVASMSSRHTESTDSQTPAVQSVEAPSTAPTAPAPAVSPVTTGSPVVQPAAPAPAPVPAVAVAAPTPSPQIDRPGGGSAVTADEDSPALHGGAKAYDDSDEAQVASTNSDPPAPYRGGMDNLEIHAAESTAVGQAQAAATMATTPHEGGWRLWYDPSGQRPPVYAPNNPF